MSDMRFGRELRQTPAKVLNTMITTPPYLIDMVSHTCVTRPARTRKRRITALIYCVILWISTYMTLFIL